MSSADATFLLDELFDRRQMPTPTPPEREPGQPASVIAALGAITGAEVMDAFGSFDKIEAAWLGVAKSVRLASGLWWRQ